MPLLLLAAIVVPWAVAAIAWPELPPRIPMHFDAAGRPDGWVATSAWVWFSLPALGTVLGFGLGLLLPRWVIGMARANSPWLNVPNKRAFVQLPEAARVRAVIAPAKWLAVLALAIQMLLAWIVFGSARVASGTWDVLPPWPSYALLAAVLACAGCLALAGSRAVRREIAASR